MARWRFGKQEDVQCIVDVQARGPKKEPLCLAYKTSSYWVGGGVYLADDGYVLRPRSGGDRYYDLPTDAAAAEGLPHPLPAYSIPWSEYAFGYSLWPALAMGLVWVGVSKRLKAKRQAKFEAVLDDTPISYGPPQIVTETDRFVAEVTAPLLRPGEVVFHQAYTLAWELEEETASAEMAFYLVLTSQRLILHRARVGAFGILRESLHVASCERAEILDAKIDDGVLMLVFGGNDVRGYQVKKTSTLSNQTAFLMNAARILMQRPD